jgi:hypothetical protein
MLKDLVKALSLANLCFIITWNELLNSPLRRSNTCFAMIINVMWFGALFWIVATLARRSGNALAMRLVRFLFPLAVLLPLNGLAQILWPGAKLISELVVLGIAIAVMALFEVMPWYHLILRGSSIGVTMLFPFVLLTMSQAFWSAINVSHPPLAPALSFRKIPAPRVLWLLFDELDQQIAFSDRPTTLQLPEMDRLRSQSLYATNVYSPSDSTLVSVPALITGKLLSNAELVSRSKLMITIDGAEKAVNWNNEPNLFSQAREAGFNTALIGWYLPCCDLIPEGLTSCSWIDFEAATLGESMSEQFGKLVGTIPFVSRVGNAYFEREELNRNKAIRSHIAVLETAKRLVVDPDMGLMLLHWQVPHSPNIYKRDTDEFQVTGESSYLDNLRLVDRTLGELRRVMEESGMWENTHVLLTSDHWWRSSIWRVLGPWTNEDADTLKSDDDHRVPFMLKLAGQKHSITYDSVFNNVLTHDLILALLGSGLSSPNSVVRWLDEHRSIGESPYRFNTPK